MYRYGYEKGNNAWIRELNYTIMQISFLTIIGFNITDKFLKKNGKYFPIFDLIHRIIYACMGGMSIAFPLLIIMLLKI